MKKIYVIPLCFYLFCVSSCQKERAYSKPNDQMDVYVVGWESDGTNHNTKYWKNDSAIILPTPGAIDLRGPAFSDGDIYIVGTSSNGTHRVATYWKNGNPVYLTDGTHDAIAYAIKVSGSDVYVGGVENYCNNCYYGFIVKYWKNGVAVNLTDGSMDAGTSDFAIVGNDVYAAGAEGDGFLYFVTYWKNGQPVHIGIGAMANSIAVSGNDVYVAGTEYGYNNETKARFWKNGTEMPFTDDLNSSAYCVTVSGSDVYVCGYEAGIAKYWKNGSPVSLGAANSFATSIVVSGNDVYVSGAESNGSHYVAKYWKNGEAINLSDGTKDEVANLIALSTH